MKRFLLILAALMLMTSCAAAQEIASPFGNVALSVEPPAGYSVEEIAHPTMIIADLHTQALGALEYHIVVSKLDVEGLDTASMADLTPEEMETMAAYAAGEMESYTHGVYTLKSGQKALVVDEVDEVDECALGYLLEGGYLLGVRADRCGTIGPLMEDDYARLLEVLEAISFEVK